MQPFNSKIMESYSILFLFESSSYKIIEFIYVLRKRINNKSIVAIF